MKTNVNIFNALNESLEKELKAKRKVKSLKEADKVNKDGNKSIRDTKTGHLKKITVSKKTQDKIPENEIINENSFNNKVSAIKKSLRKDKRTTSKSAQKSAKKIAGSMIKNESEDNDFYNYVKGLLDNGAIDDSEYYNSLSDKEKEDLIRNTWMKDKETIENYKKLNEEDVIKVNDVEIEPDYIIQDVTVLDQVGDGDVQSPDIEAMLTLVDSALKENYSKEWGHIKTLSSKIDENTSYALVDISTSEILKEFESKGIKDAAIGKNLILEKVNDKLVEFKVNNLNGTTKYSKKTSNPQKAIYEWIETEFLQEAKEEKAKEAEVAKAKTEKETVENYINNRLDLKMEIENIKMFIELSKEVKAQEEMKPAIQKRMYAFAAEVPYNIEVKSKNDQYELSFSNLDQVVEMIFGKEWVKEVTPDNEIVGVIKEGLDYDDFKDLYNYYNNDRYGDNDPNFEAPEKEVKEKFKELISKGYITTNGKQINLKDIKIIKEGLDYDENGKAYPENFTIGDIEGLYDHNTGMVNWFYSGKGNNRLHTSAKYDELPDEEFPHTDKGKIKAYIKKNFLNESQKLTEAYEQFNIGEIEVVFNPDTYETLYSIPSADVQDKKINLTKVPTVDTPYDTDTIIKSYIETRFGRIPTEEEKKAEDNNEVIEPAPETPEPPQEEEIPQDDMNIDRPVSDDSDLTEDELPEEPEENETPAEVEEELPQAETGNATFMKIRPKQSISIEDLRNQQLDGNTPTSNYIVVDNLDLSSEEFDDLSNNLNEQRSWLEGIQALDRKNYSFNVIKVTSAKAKYDLLIDPLGYNYPRYIAILDKTNKNSDINSI